MLNPFAHDFTPSGLSTPPPEKKQQTKKELPPFPIIRKKPNEDQAKKKKKVESKKPAASSTTAQQQQKPKKATLTKAAESSSSSKKKNDSQASQSSNKKPLQQQQPTHNKNRHKSSHSSSSAAAATLQTSLEDEFNQETKFIAIEASINPIHRVNPFSKKSVDGMDRRKSLVDQPKYEHGYERYIDWIDRSVRKFDTVTMVGMDNAIKDIVSMVTILYDRKLASYDDIETFTMNQGNGRFTSCIQVKLHPFF